MRSCNEFDLKELVKNRDYTKSPEGWEEQILYFLLVDRFNNGRDYPLYDPEKDYENALKSEESKKEWLENSYTWNGGSIKGIIKKLDYLEEMGITAIWLSPILKQAAYSTSYHGYGIQNFLEIDPHFGSKEDLRDLVDAAHARGMYVILDIILNHTGDVFAYQNPGPYDSTEKKVLGFFDKDKNPTIDPHNPDYNAAWPDGGVWPQEIFNLSTFSRKGTIENWDNYPEYIEGDFYSLKNIHTGWGSLKYFKPSLALETLTECYKYWIAYADLDGFRIDTVKHMFPGATKSFAVEIHEFAYSIGKKNFYLIGEIAGGLEFAKNLMEQTGLDAALGINSIPMNLENVAKGYQAADDYFSIFTNSKLLGQFENQWYQSNIITMFNDHDMIYNQDYKARFAADKEKAPLLHNALFLNLFSAGIPCIYYGTEQGFDGAGDSEKYIREAMFGGKYGAFRTQNRSFFDSENPIYKSVKKFVSIRNQELGLQMGRQYLREISFSNQPFNFPSCENENCCDVVCWSRLFNRTEYMLAINCNLKEAKTVKVMVDSDLHQPGDIFKCIYSSDSEQITDQAEVIELNPEYYYITLTVPAQGRVIFKL
ncbi:MAG: alpha-amylase family glycosyl hydrolase [bacterium]